MTIIIRALEILENEAHRLKEKLKRGEKLGWADVKKILQALGLLAGDSQIQEEAGKKGWRYLAALKMFAAFTRSL